MKGIFVIMDGVGDIASPLLGDKTPLEVAKTPNLDYFANKGKLDNCVVLKEGVAPESSSAVITLLGRDPSDAPRGPLETMGSGASPARGDLCFRCNFATIDSLEEGNILDARAGRTLTTKEAKILSSAINEKVKLPYPFEFHASHQHRGVLIIKGGFSSNISDANPFYGNGAAIHVMNPKVKFSKPLDEEDDSRLSAELLNKFLRASYEVLDNHPINKERARKGLFSANFVLARGAGDFPVKFKKLKGKWMALGYMPLEKGISKAVGMDLYDFRYPKLKGIDVYENLYSGLRKAIKVAIKMIKKNRRKYDYFYVHFKETDIPGHDNKPVDKVKMIEMIDQGFFGYLKNSIGDTKLVVTGDHTTACRKKMHTADPVPVLTYPYSGRAQKEGQRFTEFFGNQGRRWQGKKLLEGTLFSK